MVSVFRMGDLSSFSVPRFGINGAHLVHGTDIIREESSLFWLQMIGTARSRTNGCITPRVGFQGSASDSTRYSGLDLPGDGTGSPFGVGAPRESRGVGRPHFFFGLDAPDPVVGTPGPPAECVASGLSRIANRRLLFAE